MPSVSQDQAIAARIAKGIKSGKVKPKPGTASAKMAQSMSAKQLGDFTHTKARKKKS